MATSREMELIPSLCRLRRRYGRSRRAFTLMSRFTSLSLARISGKVASSFMICTRHDQDDAIKRSQSHLQSKMVLHPQISHKLRKDAMCLQQQRNNSPHQPGQSSTTCRQCHFVSPRGSTLAREARATNSQGSQGHHRADLVSHPILYSLRSFHLLQPESLGTERWDLLQAKHVPPY